MAEKQLVTPQEQRCRMAEDVWLNYFNKVLFEQALITEAQRNHMKHLISARKPSIAKSKDGGLAL